MRQKTKDERRKTKDERQREKEYHNLKNFKNNIYLTGRVEQELGGIYMKLN